MSERASLSRRAMLAGVSGLASTAALAAPALLPVSPVETVYRRLIELEGFANSKWEAAEPMQEAFMRLRPAIPREMYWSPASAIAGGYANSHERTPNGHRRLVFHPNTIYEARERVAGRLPLKDGHNPKFEAQRLEASKRLVDTVDAYEGECAALRQRLGLDTLEADAEAAQAALTPVDRELRAMPAGSLRDLGFKARHALATEWPDDDVEAILSDLVRLTIGEA